MEGRLRDATPVGTDFQQNLSCPDAVGQYKTITKQENYMVYVGLRALILRVLLLIAGTAVSVSSYATPLEWSITNPTVSAARGDTVTFTGVITNRTGQVLESTDLFLDFLAYDFNVLSPNQVLGTVPFTLPDFTFSTDVALFSVDVNLLASAEISEFQVLLQDINGNLTDVINIAIAVNGVTNNVLEPSTMALFILGFIMLLVAYNRRLIADKGNWRQLNIVRSTWL